MTFSPRGRFDTKQRNYLKTKTYEIGRFYIESVKDVKNQIITQKPYVSKPSVAADDK